MAEYFWPPDLPQRPRVPSFVKASGNNTIRSSMDMGPPKTRRRTSAAMGRLQCTFRLNREHVSCGGGERIDQLALFFDFLEAVEGMSFWLPDPLNPKEEIKVRIAPEGEETGVSAQAVSRTFFDVPLNLEVWPLARRPRS